MDQWEYIEDRFNLDKPHPRLKNIIKMRESMGWINVSVGCKGNEAILQFKRKIT